MMTKRSADMSQTHGYITLNDCLYLGEVVGVAYWAKSGPEPQLRYQREAGIFLAGGIKGPLEPNSNGEKLSLGVMRSVDPTTVQDL